MKRRTTHAHLRVFLFVLCMCLIAALIPKVPRANPAMQGVVQTFTQPDQSEIQLRLWGDEYANGWETLDGYTVVRNRASGYFEFAARAPDGKLVGSGLRVGRDAPAGEPHLRPVLDARRPGSMIITPQGNIPHAPPAWASGSTNVLVIMVQFPADAGDPDGNQPAVGASFSAAQMQANLFGATPTGPGNMTDYYNEISFGALNLVGTVVGPYTVANDKNDYDDGPSSDDALVAEAIALADAAIDFSPFDNDGDGEVDMVAIAYAGNGPDNGNYKGADLNVNNLWPHASSIGAVNVDGGARTVSEYFMAAELLNSTPRARTIGVYCHEFGHKLGLPDLYDTDNSSDGIGHWGLMGLGSWCSNNPGSENGESPSHMCAWSKWYLGWISPTDQTDTHSIQGMPQAETNPYAVRLLANPGGPDDWSGGSGEYFLIENRQRTGFDIGLDGCGILVWHIDEALNTNKFEGHTAGSHRLVDLEEADSPPEDLDSVGARGDAGDPFPGSTTNLTWGDGTSPNAKKYDGSNSDQSVQFADAACGANMLVGFNNEGPTANAGADVVAECTSPTTTTVMLNGTASSDPDGDTLSYLWSGTGVAFDDPNSPTPTGQFPDGTTVVTLTVSDGVRSDTDQVSVTIEDTTPPVITCPVDVTVECSSHCGVSKDDPQLTPFFAGVSATDVCDLDPVLSDDRLDCFPLGPTLVTFTAQDDAGNASQCTATVTVEDTTPPEIDVVLNRDALWPPNHKLVDVCIDMITVTDVCDPDPTWVLWNAESDEPDNDTGDGNTTGDIQGAAFGTADECLDLRSERQGNNDGRTYSIYYQAMDMSGNVAYDTVTVDVPHDQSGAALAASGFSADGKRLTDLGGEFALVIPGTDAVDVSALEVSSIYVGNTAGAIRAARSMLVDVNGDKRPDLALFYSARAMLAAAGPTVARTEMPGAIERTRGDGPLGLHYSTPSGVDYLVSDIYKLGSPVAVTEAPLVVAPPTGPVVMTEPAPVTVRVTTLQSIHPNPFNPQTTVSYALANAEPVRIVIYDVRGSLVRRLVDGVQGGGVHSAVWNGIDDAGRPATSGIYFVRMIAGSYTETRKIVLLK